MHFRDEDNSLRDIADAIGMIESFTADMDFEAFREDPKTVAAVERKLQVRLGEGAERRCPSLLWRDIRGIGNWLLICPHSKRPYSVL